MTQTPSTTNVTDACKGGRKDPSVSATANQEATGPTVALLIFILIDHDFINEIHTGSPERLHLLYRHFTREIVALYHSHGNRDEIRSALVLAEEHLTVILQCTDEVLVVSINLIGRALKFLQKFLMEADDCPAPSSENTETHPPIDKEGEDLDEIRVFTVAEMPTFQWLGKFTEVVQFIESIIDMEYIKDIEKNSSAFIRFMLDAFGFGHKTLKHYTASRHKQCMKIIKTENGKVRCKFLYDLFKNSERAWNIRHDQIQ